MLGIHTVLKCSLNTDIEDYIIAIAIPLQLPDVWCSLHPTARKNARKKVLKGEGGIALQHSVCKFPRFFAHSEEGFARKTERKGGMTLVYVAVEYKMGMALVSMCNATLPLQIMNHSVQIFALRAN